MKKAIIKLAVFISLIVIILLVTSEIFRPKHLEQPNNTTVKMDGYYALENNSLDVLFLGSSNAYYGFNPAVVYNETGLNSYVFAGESQSIETTYYFLIEALKTQQPEIVVIDVFGMLPEIDEYNNANVIQRNIENLNFSLNKVNAYIDLIDKPLGIFDIFTYHNRLAELKKFELTYSFEKHFDDYFGYTLGYPSSNEVIELPIVGLNDYQVPEVRIEYLEKIINLLDKNNIELLLVKTPILLSDDNFTSLDTITNYCEDNEIVFIDFNNEDYEIDYKQNRDGDVWHANVRGAKKLSTYIGTYIYDNYDIKNNNDLYRAQYLSLYSKTNQVVLRYEDDHEKFFKYLKNEDVTYVISYQQNDYFYLDSISLSYLIDLGINLENFENRNNFVYICDNNKIKYENTTTEDFEYLLSNLRYNINIKQNDGYMDISYNNDLNPKFVGINISIIDNNTGNKISDVAIATTGYIQLLRLKY
jgi:hypothetical protein